MSTGETFATVEGIERKPGVQGCYPVIAGTRFPVRSVIEQLRVNAWSIGDLLHHFEWLTREQIEAALTYYARYPDVVEEDIRRNEASAFRPAGTAIDEHSAVPR